MVSLYSFDLDEFHEITGLLRDRGYYIYITQVKEEHVKNGWPPYMVVVSKEGPKDDKPSNN